MAKKRKARRAPKSQGITLNWAIVGLIVVIALLIGLWQINGKPESKAADTDTWPQVVNQLSANIQLDGDVNLSWTINSVQLPYELVGYRVMTTPYGATAPKTFNLGIGEVSSTVLQGEKATRYYVTVKDPSMVMPGHGMVGLYPVERHPTYAPNSTEVESAGKLVSAMLEY